MGFHINIKNMHYITRAGDKILQNINLNVESGQFVAILGENGAGKTTLLDLLMGFKKTSSGEINIEGFDPSTDPHEKRNEIAYLSEKVDIPGDWTVETFLEFNRFFYKDYSPSFEKHLIHEFNIKLKNRIGNLSAGEIRRIQLVGALSINPKLIIVDEITAVLDIIGRKKFMDLVSDYNIKNKTTVLLATNILEDLEKYISHVFLMHQGHMKLYQSKEDFLKNAQGQFSDGVANILESA